MSDVEVSTLPDNVSILNCSNGSVVYLVGTPHFSEKSEEDVAEVITKVKPDAVLLELCANRKGILTIDESITDHKPNGFSRDSLKEFIKIFGVTQGLCYQLLLYIVTKFTREAGVVPYGEVRRAFKEAIKNNSIVYLGDRPFIVTIKRAISMMSWLQCFRFVRELLFKTNFKITKEDMEKYESIEVIEDLEVNFSAEFPELFKVMCDEREKYLTYSLQKSVRCTINETGVNYLSKKPRVVVGVVGLVHVAGIKKYWQTITEDQIDELMTIPPRSRSSQYLEIVIYGHLLVLIGWTISILVGGNPLTQMAYDAAHSTWAQGNNITIN